MDDFESFWQYCENCTDAQVIAVYEKERDAGRAVYAAIAKAVACRRMSAMEFHWRHAEHAAIAKAVASRRGLL